MYQAKQTEKEKEKAQSKLESLRGHNEELQLKFDHLMQEVHAI